MKKLWVALLVFALLAAPALAKEVSEQAMDFIGARDFEALYEMSDDGMRAQLGAADMLSQVWGQLEGTFGAYSGYESIAPVSGAEGYAAYDVACDFESAAVTLRLSFSMEGKLAGLAVAGYAYKPAPPDALGGFVEEDIVLRPGAPDETKGRRTLPEGPGPFPWVIMMQGSGASDMNESAYGIPIFEQLARLLARCGVASVRYDKYPFAHPEKSVEPGFSVDDEYARDAADALALLTADARVAGIYLLGHSQGAMVAPRVAEKIGPDALSGVVLLAGTPLPLHELLLRQLSDMDEDTAELEAQFDAMWDMDEAAQKAEMAMGTPLYYWRDAADYDYAGQIVALNLPAFIAQGGKDFQVLPGEGIEAYRAALEGYEGAAYALYPDMNHLLCDMEGEATGTAADYMGEKQVSQKLAEDIAAWIYGMED